ncbi:hypothetical protein ACVISU_003525 [Bradyrhizobium sp. USDA 4452]
MDSVVWIDADQVCIERRMMNFRKRKTVLDERLAKLFISVGHDVGGIEQSRLGQARYRAPVAIGTQNRLAERRLMKTLPDKSQAISSLWRIWNGPLPIRRGRRPKGEPHLQLRSRPIGNVSSGQKNGCVRIRQPITGSCDQAKRSSRDDSSQFVPASRRGWKHHSSGQRHPRPVKAARSMRDRKCRHPR